MKFPITPQQQERLLQKGEFFVTEITHEVINTLTAWIIRNRPKRSKFTILINSSGGEPSAILMFASFLATLDRKVRIAGVAFGECGSAAFALLQCCHERIAVKHCAFFIHHINLNISESCFEADMAKIERQLADARNLEEELAELQSTRCKMNRSDWMKLADEGEKTPGRAILRDDALRMKLVDKYVDHYTIF